MNPDELRDQLLFLIETGRSKEAGQTFARTVARHGLGALVEMAKLADRNYPNDHNLQQRRVIVRAAAQFTNRMVDLTYRISTGNVEGHEIANAVSYLNAIDFAEMRYNLESANHEFDERLRYIAEATLRDVTNTPDMTRPVLTSQPPDTDENRPPGP